MTSGWSADERALLLALARQALEAAVRRAPAPCAAGAQVYDHTAGAFVTLRAAGDLRGCVGQMSPRSAGLSCTVPAPRRSGSRFTPVTDRELAGFHRTVGARPAHAALRPLEARAGPARPGRRHGAPERAAAATSGGRVGVDR